MVTVWNCAIAAKQDKVLEAYSSFPFFALDISKLTGNDIETMLNALYDSYGLRGINLNKAKAAIFDSLNYALSGGYIKIIPEIKPRQILWTNIYHKPDEKKLKKVIIANQKGPVKTIIILSWKCGLSRNEIPFVKFSQVDYEHAKLVMPDREIPLEKETLSFLKSLEDDNKRYSDYILISKRHAAPMAEQSISRILRDELDKFGLTDIRLVDLRFNYIINQLKIHNLQDASYITGNSIQSLRAQYLPYINEAIETKAAASASYDDLYQFMIEEGSSPCGLIMWLFWQMGFSQKEISALTWDDVDFSAATIKEKPIPTPLFELLKELKTKHEKFSDHIIISNRSKKPLDYQRFAKLLSETLVKNGITGVGIHELSHKYSPEIEKRKCIILRYIEKKGCANCNEIIADLGLTKKESLQSINKLIDLGSILRIGTEYYLTGGIVNPDDMPEAILEFVREHPLCERKSLCEHLGIVKKRQFGPIIKPLIDSGEIIQIARKYKLP